MNRSESFAFDGLYSWLPSAVAYLLLAIFGLALSPAPATAFQSIAPSADAHVYAYHYRNWNKSNVGEYAQLAAGWHPLGGEKRTYIKFALPKIPKVKKAVLRLYISGIYGKPGQRLAVYMVGGPWKEGKDTYHSGQVEKTAGPGELSWSQQPRLAGSGWVFSPGGKPNVWMGVDVTRYVNAWLAGSPNHGLAIVPYGAKTAESGYLFHSREYKDPEKRPRLALFTADDPITRIGSPPGGAGVVMGGGRPSGNLLLNPGFEQGKPAGSFITLPPGSKDLPGWDVTRPTIDVVQSYWKSSGGKRSLDLNGSPGVGAVAQTVPTVPGKKYTLSFDLAGNPNCGPLKMTLLVRAAGQSTTYLFDTKGKTTRAMGWQKKRFVFSARTNQTRLEFISLSKGDNRCGPAIDNLNLQGPAPGGPLPGKPGKVTAPPLDSGTYHTEATWGKTWLSAWTLKVSGSLISGYSKWTCCPGPRTDPLKGRISGSRVIIERNCTGQGNSGPCLQVYSGELKGGMITGTWAHNGKKVGTWKLFLTGPAPAIAAPAKPPAPSGGKIAAPPGGAGVGAPSTVGGGQSPAPQKTGSSQTGPAQTGPKTQPPKVTGAKTQLPPLSGGKTAAPPQTGGPSLAPGPPAGGKTTPEPGSGGGKQDRIQKKADRLKRDGELLEKKGRIEQALAKYDQSLKLVPDANLQKHADGLRAGLAKTKQDKTKAKQLRDQAAKLEKAGELEASLEKYRISLQYEDHSGAKNKVWVLENRIADLKKRAESLRVTGRNWEQKGDLKKAVDDYKKSLVYWPDQELEQHIAKLESKRTDQKQAKAKAQKLYEKGKKLEGQKQYPQALKAYQRSLNAFPLNNAKQGEKRMKKRRQLANDLERLGISREARKDISGARKAYQQSLGYWFLPSVQKRLDSLEAGKGGSLVASATIDGNCHNSRGSIVVPAGMVATGLSGTMSHGGLPCSGPEFPKSWGGCIRGADGLYFWFQTTRLPFKQSTLGKMNTLVLGPGTYTVCIWGGKPSYWDVRYTLKPGTGPFSATIKGPGCCGMK